MTRQFLIDEAKENYEINKDKPYESQLFDLISTMVNTDGFKHDEVTVFNMNIVAFFNSVKRIQKRAVLPDESDLCCRRTGVDAEKAVSLVCVEIPSRHVVAVLAFHKGVVLFAGREQRLHSRHLKLQMDGRGELFEEIRHGDERLPFGIHS